MRTALVTLTMCLLALPTNARYSGGTGEPNDPYQIATAADLIALGETPEDYDKHFILTADIDLDPNLPGRKVFHRAVIAPEPNSPRSGGRSALFTGVFDGNGHTISHLTITGKQYLGLFGHLGSAANVFNLGLEAVEVTGGFCVGGLAAWNEGRIVSCYSDGTVSGSSLVACLVGNNWGSITASYSSGSVSGESVGGLVGDNRGSITRSYSSGSVSGTASAGGLVGSGVPFNVSACTWDAETSGLFGSAGGVGLMRGEMMDACMLGLNGFANDPNWVLEDGRDYPRLAWEGTPGDIIPEPEIDWLGGRGTAEVPYAIDTADQLILLSKAFILWNKHFALGASIDLDPTLPGRSTFAQAVIPVFTGVFDGSGHTISHLTITGKGYLGLFGYLGSAASVFNLGLEAVEVSGGSYIGGLAAVNDQGSIAYCYSSGLVSGSDYVGGLVGSNKEGSISMGHSTGIVRGYGFIGGLVGQNGSTWRSRSTVTQCYSSASVFSADSYVGGLVGHNWGSIAASYSTGPVSGYEYIGGLVGMAIGNIAISYSRGSVTGSTSVGGLAGYSIANITASYSTGMVAGKSYVGGLVGRTAPDGGREPTGTVTGCSWDVQTSGQTTSTGGIGRTTAEMQRAATFLDAGWDFVGEAANGSEDIWWILEGKDYPRLWWEGRD